MAAGAPGGLLSLTTSLTVQWKSKRKKQKRDQGKNLQDLGLHLWPQRLRPPLTGRTRETEQDGGTPQLIRFSEGK